MKKETGLILFFGGLLLANRLLYPKPTQQDLQFIESSKTSGEKYGYPPCCIEEFIKHTPSYCKKNSATEIDRMRYEASKINGEYSGFIPCANHAQAILSGKITIESLIQNRDPDLKEFPNDWTHE